MDSADIHERKLKLNNIIKKITDSKLLKLCATEGNDHRPDTNFPINQQKERDNETNKAMAIKLLNEKDLCHYGANALDFKTDVPVVNPEMTAPLPKPVGPGVPL